MSYSVHYKYKLEASNIFVFLNIGLFSDILLVVTCLVSLLHPFVWFPKKDLRGERLVSQQWMQYKELPRYITVIENLFLRDRISSEKK